MSHIPTLVVTTWLTPNIVFPDRPWRSQWQYSKNLHIKKKKKNISESWLRGVSFYFLSHTPLHWMGQTVLLGSSASQPQSHSCSRWAAHSARWASVQQPWQMRIQQVEMKCVSEAHRRLLQSPLTVHRMTSLTPGAQMPGSPGSHTARRQTKTSHEENNIPIQESGCLSTYVTHVIMPGARDLR